jgi:hypothetical protein
MDIFLQYRNLIDIYVNICYVCVHIDIFMQVGSHLFFSYTTVTHYVLLDG